MKRKAALKDIAQKVGVSTALVSYVMNNQEEEKRVGKEMAVRIRAAAAELNYTTNHIAKSLKTRKTNTIGFIVADINYRYSSGVMKAIEAECKLANLTVIYGSSGESSQTFTQLVNFFVDRQVDGLILVPVENCTPQIEYLTRHEVPFVLIDRILPDVEANMVGIDNAKAASVAVRQLTDSGHKRIGFISYHSTLANLAERKKGYLEALEQAGLKADPALIKEVSNRPANEQLKRLIDHAIDELLALPNPCDALFFATDTLAVNGLRHINSLHLKVPEQIGIVSFDDSEAFELFYCPIAHGCQPLEEIGRVAVATLLEAMKDSTLRKKITLETGFQKGPSSGKTG